MTKGSRRGGDSPQGRATRLPAWGNEKPLHAALKEWYANPGDDFEMEVDGFIIDIVRDDLLVEIQTANYSAMRRKLACLLEQHPVRLVMPVAARRWLVKLPKSGRGRPERRRSPKRGAVVDLFAALVSFPELMQEPRFSLEVLLTHEEEVRRHVEGQAWRRKGWVTVERRLLEVVQAHRFDTPDDLLGLLPADLEDPFTTADLAAALSKPRRVAQQMAYCLRKMGAITQVGHRARSVLYVRE